MGSTYLAINDKDGKRVALGKFNPIPAKVAGTVFTKGRYMIIIPSEAGKFPMLSCAVGDRAAASIIINDPPDDLLVLLYNARLISRKQMAGHREWLAKKDADAENIRMKRDIDEVVRRYGAAAVIHLASKNPAQRVEAKP